MNFRLSLLPAAFAAAVLLTSCAPNLGSTIEAPQLPPTSADPASRPEARARLGSYVTVQEVVDSRNGISADADENTTEPYGGVNVIVENGLKNAFRDAGVGVTDSAPISIKAQVTKWRAHVNAKGTSAINSEATLFVEVYDPSGKRIYSGTYNGSRSSQFPVVTRVDVKDSLGLAMNNAISQVIADPQLLELLASF
ncbi:MAG: YajG family lipoprotein [Bdellovibrionota bacterium]